MKKVLLTGGSGFIGSNVLKFLLEETDFDFTCLCSWRHHGSPIRITPNKRVNVITHDLRAPIPDIGHFDYILNLASESHVDRSIVDPVNFIENNVSSTLQVLEYARKYTPLKFIQFSTDEVYGAHEHSEWDILLPTNPYSASKAAQEVISIAYWNSYKIPVIITNSNNIVGPMQDSEKYIPKLIDKIIKGERISIHVYDGKPGVRYYNPVRNVGSALLFILTNCDVSKATDRPLRFNLPGGEALDNFEIANKVASILGMPLFYDKVDVRSIRPSYDSFYPETQGALSDLGWTPPYSLDGELVDLCNQYLIDFKENQK